jgi:hypothetical protein
VKLWALAQPALTRPSTRRFCRAASYGSVLWPRRRTNTSNRQVLEPPGNREIAPWGVCRGSVKGSVTTMLRLQQDREFDVALWTMKMGGTPLEQPEVYGRANVLARIRDIRTQLLIMHWRKGLAGSSL